MPLDLELPLLTGTPAGNEPPELGVLVVEDFEDWRAVDEGPAGGVWLSS